MDMIKKLYISDLDGTLLNSSAELSDYTTKSLNNMIEQGLNFSIATARLLTPVCKMLSDVKLNVPIILMNGVLIYDMNQESYIKVNELESDTVMTVIKIIREFEISSFMYELNDGELMIYHETFKKSSSQDYINERIARYNSSKGFTTKAVEKVIYFTLMDTYEHLKPVYDVLSKHKGFNQTLYKNIYSEDLWYLEVFSDVASKQTAVEYLRNIYGYNQIIGFGDNHNDIPLFEACDVCVAVENATSEIKEAADYICDTNNNDGVIKWLEKNHSVE